MTSRHGDIRTCPFILKSHPDFRTACRVELPSQTTLPLNSRLCPGLPFPPGLYGSPGHSMVSALPVISIRESASREHRR